MLLEKEYCLQGLRRVEPGLPHPITISRASFSRRVALDRTTSTDTPIRQEKRRSFVKRIERWKLRFVVHMDNCRSHQPATGHNR